MFGNGQKQQKQKQEKQCVCDEDGEEEEEVGARRGGGRAGSVDMGGHGHVDAAATGEEGGGGDVVDDVSGGRANCPETVDTRLSHRVGGARRKGDPECGLRAPVPDPPVVEGGPNATATADTCQGGGGTGGAELDYSQIRDAVDCMSKDLPPASSSPEPDGEPDGVSGSEMAEHYSWGMCCFLERLAAAAAPYDDDATEGGDDVGMVACGERRRVYAVLHGGCNVCVLDQECVEALPSLHEIEGLQDVRLDLVLPLPATPLTEQMLMARVGALEHVDAAQLVDAVLDVHHALALLSMRGPPEPMHSLCIKAIAWFLSIFTRSRYQAPSGGESVSERELFLRFQRHNECFMLYPLNAMICREQFRRALSYLCVDVADLTVVGDDTLSHTDLCKSYGVNTLSHRNLCMDVLYLQKAMFESKLVSLRKPLRNNYKPVSVWFNPSVVPLDPDTTMCRR